MQSEYQPHKIFISKLAKEAKKDPQELTVEQKLKALFQLQTMLSKIDEIKTLRGELPLEVQDL